MPKLNAYITFSKKFPEQRKALRELRSSFEDSSIILRGSKSIDKIVKDASLKGFEKIIIIERLADDELKAISIRSRFNKGKLEWDYGKEFKASSIKELLKKFKN
ncbi:MAG: hypothetical protein ACP5RI_01210 [Candidatus Micrarchaeia archaeon]